MGGESDGAGLRGPGLLLMGFTGFQWGGQTTCVRPSRKRSPWHLIKVSINSTRLRSTELVQTSHSEIRKLRSREGKTLPQALTGGQRNHITDSQSGVFPQLPSCPISGRGVSTTTKC